ncbi:MAG: hypothetical protein RMM29_00235 [Planctomycetota bacterium]|nr:hypothetical protein [Planctomycetota bacterium]MCX8039297.1 hypothetical protein [Planctomycetota bacterium]MDW8372062.1 hypothetical protein [Planctomycetota bacterium]
MIPAWLATETTSAAPGLPPLAALGWAVALLLLAGVLAVLECFIVSWGMLALAAAISAVVAIVMAFQVSTLTGWAFVVVAPALLALVLRFGLRRMQRHPLLVLPAEITEATGARRLADQGGLGPGAEGELLTDAYPTGRARFVGPRGPVAIDVQVQGGGRRGARVRILDFDGPVVHVMALPDDDHHP